jgi:hypothetical protein
MKLKGCPQCKNWIDNKFCPDCGSPRGSYKEMREKETVGAGDVLEEVGEVLEFVEYDGKPFTYWYANVDETLFTQVENKATWRAREEVIDLTSLDPKAECELFEKQFAEAMVILRRIYGTDNVKLKWGVICEIS